MQLKSYCEQVLAHTYGLKAIMITDSDGAVLLSIACDDVPDNMLNVATGMLYTISSDLSGKFGLGKNVKITQKYQAYNILQKNYNPFILTLISDGDAPIEGIWGAEQHELEIAIHQLLEDHNKNNKV
eukprot:NODE_29_length_37665_cov_1.081563.p26 type:complete len:127 gc:universal NODE_29_length_37665_cov_1.081563:13496-13876(+)